MHSYSWFDWNNKSSCYYCKLQCYSCIQIFFRNVQWNLKPNCSNLCQILMSITILCIDEYANGLRYKHRTCNWIINGNWLYRVIIIIMFSYNGATSNWWRVVFLFPSIICIIRSSVIHFIYNYDCPE